MNLRNLSKAIEEAKRFLVVATELELAHNSPEREHITGLPVEQGAAQRASMDLTRALARLRNERVS